MRHGVSAFLYCSGLGLSLLLTSAQQKADVMIFDEDDAIGLGYYDASFGSVSVPSKLKRGGPGDKLIIETNQFFTGRHSALLEWQSAPGGAWRLFISRVGFQTADASGLSNLVLHVNAPQTISAPALPRVGLESSPPDVQTAALKLGDYLQTGVDGDPTTWQQITVPLSAFPPKQSFSLAKLKAAFFSQGEADNVPHTLWVDNVRITDGGSAETNAIPPAAPANVVTRAGDRSVVLHWDRNVERDLAGYNIYRSSGATEALARLTPAPVPIQSFADLAVLNGETYFYSVRAVNRALQESPGSPPVSVTPRAFASDDDFLEYVQQTAFDYFWYEANPGNGLIRDRSDPSSAGSIAAVGFGLTAIGVGVDHGWITRGQGAERALTTLRTFAEKPQGTNLTGTIGHKGWFYHFLDMETGLRYGTTELSSIDTALLLAGILSAQEYFDGASPNEVAIRSLAESIVDRVDWHWMANRQNSLSHGWRPEFGFIPSRWIGYNEGMILYLLGLGAATNPLPAVHWETWTSGYSWRTNYSQAFLHFPPLFGHQYSHCWVDFRHKSDAYMRARGLTYFENSRRATLAQRNYAIANPGRFSGYSSNLWGLTACDGPGIAPFHPYIARGTPPQENDDGTIAPTAAGGSLPFTPEYSLPALRAMYEQFRTHIWTGYGFRDAFNLTANWWGPHVLAIDQGPILLMAENFRSGRVWQRFMRSPAIQRGLQAAGFQDGAFVPAGISRGLNPGVFAVRWSGPSEGVYQVEYSANLNHWLISASTPPNVGPISGGLGRVIITPVETGFTWLDTGPPATLTPPALVPRRFYRVFELPGL